MKIAALVLSLSISCLFSNQLSSQSDFRDGYIVNHNNDTIYGLIDYKGNLANSKKCIFKKDSISEKQRFTPNEISTYRFIGSKCYVSKPVVSQDQAGLLFLEYLINGTVDIYYYREGLQEHYFVDIGDDKLYELKNEEKEVVINDHLYIKDSREYIGVLKVAFKESPSITKKVENIELTHESLVSIAHDYHSEICPDEDCVIYEKRFPDKERKFGLLIGISAISISQVADFPIEYYYMQNSNFDTEIFPSIGFFYKTNMPFYNENLYFQYELTYSKMNLIARNSFIESDYDMDYINDISLNQNAVNNYFLAKYEFPKGKFRPTFQAGAFFDFFFLSKYKRELEVKYSWGETYFTDENLESPFTCLDLGLSLGAGIVYSTPKEKEIFIDLRYQRGFGLLDRLNSNTFTVKLGVQIGQ